MTYRDEQRLADIAAAITALHEHLRRGELTDGLVFDAGRIRPLEIGEAVKARSGELLSSNQTSPGDKSPPCAITWPIDTSTRPTRSSKRPWTTIYPSLRKLSRAS